MLTPESNGKALRAREEIFGLLFLAGSLYMICLAAYQELVLVCKFGPQIGYWWYQMATGPKLGAISVLLSMIWFAGVIVYLLLKRRRPILRQWILVAATCLVILVVFDPLNLWRCLTICRCGTGPHEVDFLVEAAGNGDLAVVNYLLGKGADSNSYGVGVGWGSETPLIAASRAGNIGIAMTLILHGSQPCLMDSDGHTASQIAEAYGHAQLSVYLRQIASCK